MQPLLPVGSTSSEQGMLSFDLRLSLGEALELSQGDTFIPSEERIYTRAYLLGVSLGLTEKLSASITGSVLDVTFTGEDQRTVGIGATTIFVNRKLLTLEKPRPSLLAGLGIALPGGGVPQPNVTASSLSAASYNPMLSLSSELYCGDVLGILAEGLWRPTLLSAGKFGRQPGALARAALGARLKDKRGSLDAKVEGLWRAPDEGPLGLTENSGGSWLYLSHSARIAPPLLRGGWLFGEVRLPLIQKLNGEQLADGISGQIGLSYSVRVFHKEPLDEDEEPHEERLPPPAGEVAGLDIQSAIVDGHYEPPGSLIVPGKVTILDYGASWCHPCQDLFIDLLWLLLEEFPNVAIRKVDIVDWDLPMATRYLSNKTDKLPYVEIYNEQGELVLSSGYDIKTIQSELSALAH